MGLGELQLCVLGGLIGHVAGGRHVHLGDHRPAGSVVNVGLGGFRLAGGHINAGLGDLRLAGSHVSVGLGDLRLAGGHVNVGLGGRPGGLEGVLRLAGGHVNVGLGDLRLAGSHVTVCLGGLRLPGGHSNVGFGNLRLAGSHVSVGLDDLRLAQALMADLAGLMSCEVFSEECGVVYMATLLLLHAGDWQQLLEPVLSGPLSHFLGGLVGPPVMSLVMDMSTLMTDSVSTV